MSDEINPAYLQPGTQIGFYEVVKLVGNGGFGALYKVVRRGQVFAVKLSTSKFAELSEEDRTNHMVRAKREAGALMQLRHPNVVQVHGFEQWPDIDNGFPYLVMDFVDGSQLYEWRRKRQPSLRQITLVFQKIALALNEIHRCEIFHRDLKSENVLIRSADGEPILVDFGLARPRSTYTVTHANDIIGSLSTFTPEYCKHAFSVGKDDKRPFVYRPTTDLHAVGFMLYEVLTGQPPFDTDAERQIDLIVEIEGKVPTRPSVINLRVPGSLDDIAMKLLEKEPQNRFQTGLELAVALAKALESADATWDAPLKTPASLKPDGPTQDMRPRASDEAARETAERPPRLSDTRVQPITEPVQPLAQAENSAKEAPAEQNPPPGPTQTAPISKPAFFPPIEEKAFVPPDAAPVKEQHSPAASSFTSAIRKIRIADRGIWAGSKVAPLLVGLGILLIAVFATALFVAKRAKEARRPESLLAKFQAQAPPIAEADLQDRTAAVPSVLGSAVTPKDTAKNEADGTRVDHAKQQDSRRGGVRNTNTNSDKANIDAILASKYGRLNIPEKGEAHRAAFPDPPWLQRGHRVDAAAPKQTVSAQKKLGVPFGTHLRVRLATNLDSRTIGDGLVEATLMRPFLKAGALVLPSKTMLYGQAHTSGGRFTVQFFRLRLPDNTEVPFSGLAADTEDNKPGLAASGRIAGPPASNESLASKVVKNTASTMLGKLTGEDATDVARGAGQTALSYSDGNASFSTGDALLLDAGREFEVIVKETF